MTKRATGLILSLLVVSSAAAATFTVTNTNDSGAGSLRQAILSANAGGGTVAFNITSATRRIGLVTVLPSVKAGVVVDGTTQNGYAGAPLVEIDGTQIAVTSFWDGACFPNVNGTVKGLAIGSCPGFAIHAFDQATLASNYLGLDVSGTAARPNFGGVYVLGDNVSVTNNVISGNTRYGVDLDRSGVVTGNRIGTNAAGTASIGNGSGVFFFSTNLPSTIGGSAPGAGNLISGNYIGIEFSYSSNGTVEGNTIGLSATGTPLGNGIGIRLLQSSSNGIAHNTISASQGAAISVEGGNAIHNRISENSIYGNGFGIDLYSNPPPPYVTPNDPGDGDTGPNTLQNFPVLASARSVGGTTTITGTLNSTPNQSFTVEFFSSPSCDGSGYGQGQTYLGKTNVSTNGSGDGSFTLSLPITLSMGSVVTSTATDVFGNTSEFSACAALQGAGTFGFASTFVVVNEGAGAAVLTVTRSNGAGGAVSVAYGTSSGTAIAGTDFTAVSGILNFADGETSKTISVPLIDDAIFEGDVNAWFTVSLSNPTGGANLGTASIAVSIADNDPRPVLSINDVRIIEGNSGTKTATFTVTLTPAVVVAVSTLVSISPGTATAGDFDLFSPFTLTFQPGDTQKPVNVVIHGDLDVEADEVFYVSLASPTNATLGKSTGTGTIINDDFAIIPGRQSIATGSTTTLVFDAGGAPNTARIVSLSSSNTTVATVPGSVTIAPGFSRVDIPVTGVAPGDATILATAPPELGGGSITAVVTVYDGVAVSFEPASLSLQPGASVSVKVSTKSPLSQPLQILLSAMDASIVETPSSVSLPTTGSATFSVKALKAGTTSIRAQLPPQNGAGTILLPVSVAEGSAGPSLTRIQPSNGPTAGGTTLSIEGVNLTNDCSITVGGTPATNVTRQSALSLTAVTPPHAAGTVDVALSCSAGGFTLPNAFTYVAGNASISGVVPSFGSSDGGTYVRISGAGFLPGCWPFFDRAAARNATMRSASEIIAASPPHGDGTVDVSLRCGESTAATLRNAYTYVASREPSPLVTSLDPPAASAGQPVTIGGARFAAGDRVSFDTTAAAILSTAPDALVVRVPEVPPGKVSVIVTDSNGNSSTTGPIFTVSDPPVPQITSATPSTARPGSEITLDGSGFRPGLSFSLGSARATTVSMRYQRAVIRVPDLAPGSYPLTVLNAAGQVAAAGPTLTVAARGVMLSSITPGCATTDGTLMVTLGGSGFESGAAVTFDGVAAISANVVDATTITATFRAGPPGAPVVAVTNSSGERGTLSGALQVFSPLDPIDVCGARHRPVHH
jgi:hypothetical protein